jgi:hypothetical protein
MLRTLSLILEVQIRTLKPALYIKSVYLYGLPARASFVTRLRVRWSCSAARSKDTALCAPADCAAGGDALFPPDGFIPGSPARILVLSFYARAMSTAIAKRHPTTEITGC